MADFPAKLAASDLFQGIICEIHIKILQVLKNPLPLFGSHLNAIFLGKIDNGHT